MFGGPEFNYHQTYSAGDWLSILRTPYPTQNLQRKHSTEEYIKIKEKTSYLVFVSFFKYFQGISLAKLG